MAAYIREILQIMIGKCLYFSIFLIVVFPKLLLKLVNCFLVHLKCLRENLWNNTRIRSKYSICNRDNPWILDTKSYNCYCILLTHIELEVNQTIREHKHISLVEHFGKETVTINIGRNRANQECTLYDNKDLNAS